LGQETIGDENATTVIAKYFTCYIIVGLSVTFRNLQMANKET